MLKYAAILLLIASAAFAEAPPASPTSKAKESPNPIPIATEAAKDGDKPVFEYRQGGDLAKPYVVRLFSPAGVNVLRDQIADHLHHHGLMFAVGIDGVDFWSETKDCGHEVFESFARATDVPADADWAESFRTELSWAGPQGGPLLAREDRRIRAYRRQPLGATLITWNSRLQPAGGRASVKLAGSHYFGLGMRFVESMDNADDFFTPDGKAVGETVRGNERLVRGKWCAYAAQADGKPVTVAMFDSPRNVRPAWWFIMAKPFAYMSAALNLHREPLTVEAGKPLMLTYGVAVWDGKARPEEITKLYDRWLELTAPRPETK